MRPESATGRNYIAILFFNSEMGIISKAKSESIAGSETWREMKVMATVPQDAIDILVGCFSEDNKGSVLFDDLSLVRIS